MAWWVSCEESYLINRHRDRTHWRTVTRLVYMQCPRHVTSAMALAWSHADTDGKENVEIQFGPNKSVSQYGNRLADRLLATATCTFVTIIGRLIQPSLSDTRPVSGCKLQVQLLLYVPTSSAYYKKFWEELIAYFPLIQLGPHWKRRFQQ
jgi:hypothetical protein